MGLFDLLSMPVTYRRDDERYRCHRDDFVAFTATTLDSRHATGRKSECYFTRVPPGRQRHFGHAATLGARDMHRPHNAPPLCRMGTRHLTTLLYACGAKYFGLVARHDDSNGV